jgi:hypothetical protein
MHVCLLCAFIFLALESNEECTEEGKIFEYQEEEDQGQANQGKPSILDAYLNLSIHLHVSERFIQTHDFIIAITPR